MTLLSTRSYVAAGMLALAGMVGSVSVAAAPPAAAAAAKKEITWAGCEVTKTAFMAELAKGFEAKTGIKVKLQGGGASAGIRLTASGKTDTGGTCRHRLFVNGMPVGIELRSHMYQVAWDALVVITHPTNPVSNISVADLKKVYNGKIKNWKELGGEDQPIVIGIHDDKYDGVGQMFRMLAFGYQEYEFLADVQKFASTGPLESFVEKTPYSIAVDGISSAKRRKLKVLSLDNMVPTKEMVGTGKYPWYRPLYLVTNAEPSAESLQLIEYALSPEGQKIIADQGTVNLSEGQALEPLWEKTKAKLGFQF